MNIIPKLTVALSLMVGAIMATSCADDIETGINTDPTGNAISFTPAVGHSTRATETTIDNLGNFAVVARGMHHDGVLYDNYLIGSSTSGEIAKRNAHTTGETTGTWKLDRSVYWPSSLTNVLFFAYTSLKYVGESENVDVFGVNTEDTEISDKTSFGFNGDNPYINNYKPSKNGVSSTDGVGGIWSDGKNQRDLLVAFTQQARTESATNVNINFEHALTQVSITARQNGKLNDDNRIVKIKGAWIVNATTSGNLTTSSSKAADFTMTYTKNWVVDSKTTKTSYGSFYTDIVSLNDEDDMDLLREHSLMLVPENLTAWNRNQDENDNEIANNGGAYIMLLCRVELKHAGTSHSGTDIGDIAIEGDYHYHQLFPVNEEEFNGAEYGFVCVPLETDWNTSGIGKHYTYNLNICGNGTGAGKYPPEMSEEDVAKLVPSGTKVAVVGNVEPQNLEIVTSRPNNKKVGDNVLDEPIQFTVSVDKWKTTGGNIKL